MSASWHSNSVIRNESTKWDVGYPYPTIGGGTDQPGLAFLTEIQTDKQLLLQRTFVHVEDEISILSPRPTDY